MTPEQALEEARKGELRPVYLVLGEEGVLSRRVSRALREAAVRGGVPGLNDDQLVAGDCTVDHVIGACRTLPMLARRRLVLVKQVERWEQGVGAPAAAAKSTSGGTAGAQPGASPKGKSEKGESALDRLAEYVKAPASSTVLVLVASKLDQRRKVVAAARSAGALVACDPLGRRDLPAWVARAFRERGHGVAPGVAEAVAELAGPDLGSLEDAVERTSLYLDPGATVDLPAVARTVVNVREATLWPLVDAVARRDAPTVMALLGSVVEDPGDAIRLVGSLASSARQLVRYQVARQQGEDSATAAATAGAPPFKARDLEQAVRSLTPSELERWLELLASVDRALKGGSRRPPRAILEHALLRWCARRPPAGAGTPPPS